MSYELFWYLENRVLFVGFFDQVSLEDALNFHAELPTLLDTGTAPIYLVTNLNAIETISRDSDKWREIISAFKNPAIGGILTFYDLNEMTHFLMMMVEQLFRIPHWNFESIDDGLRFLVEYDRELPEDWLMDNFDILEEWI